MSVLRLLSPSSQFHLSWAELPPRRPLVWLSVPTLVSCSLPQPEGVSENLSQSVSQSPLTCSDSQERFTPYSALLCSLFSLHVFGSLLYLQSPYDHPPRGSPPLSPLPAPLLQPHCPCPPLGLQAQSCSLLSGYLAPDSLTPSYWHLFRLSVFKSALCAWEFYRWICSQSLFQRN